MALLFCPRWGQKMQSVKFKMAGKFRPAESFIPQRGVAVGGSTAERCSASDRGSRKIAVRFLWSRRPPQTNRCTHKTKKFPKPIYFAEDL